jgi:hypothetical protein
MQPFLIAKSFVRFGRLLQRNAVGDDEGRLYLASFDLLQWRLHVTVHVRLPRL